MRSAFIVAACGLAAVWLGLVLAAAVFIGFLVSLAGGLIVAGVVALIVAERILAPVKQEPARWPR